MAEHGSLAACENRRKAAAVPGHRRVPDRIRATVQEMEAAALDGAADSRGRIAQTPELGVRHDPVLSPRQTRQLPLRSYFIPHTGIKYDLKGIRSWGNICSPG